MTSIKDFILAVIALATAIVIVEGLLLVLYVAFRIMATITTIIVIAIVAFLIYDTIRSRR